MSTQLESASAAPTAPPTDWAGEPPPKPVVGWAVAGACFLAIEMWIISRWILAGDAYSPPSGPTHVPSFTVVCVRCVEVVGLLGAVVIVYFCLYRPWKRTRRVSLDGWLIIVFVLLWWQDPLQNYFQIHVTYSSVFYSLGSWTPQVPGWVSPNTRNIAVPLAWGPAYIWLGLGPAMLANIVMRRAKQRWPGLSRLGVVFCGLAFLCLFEFTVEPAFLRTGVWAYPGAIRSFTLFAGKTYQFPVYEGLCMVIWWGSFACIRYFRDNNGQTWAERGLERLGASSRRKTAIRFLALLGIFNVAYLTTYTVPMALIAAHSDAWPRAIQQRSDLTDLVCGPGTNYACPNPALPAPQKNSAHFNPAGRLIVPKGRQLPFSRAEQTDRR